MDIGRRMRISLLPFFAVVVALFPLATPTHRVALPPPRPLCASQYNLASYACTHLPYMPGPPPSPSSPPSPLPAPPSPDDDDERRHHNRGHRRRHRRHRDHYHQETPVEAECCKWLTQVDNECVCDVLVHLPSFLVRPIHNYTVVVDESCSVTYSCSGRVIR